MLPVVSERGCGKVFLVYHLDEGFKPGRLYGSKKNQEGAGTAKNTKKGISLPSMRP
jgi:hypothetical protein